MTSERIRQSIDAAVGYVSSHPYEGRYQDSPATATVENGLRIRVRGPGTASVATDMPAAVGGTDSAPSPGWLLRAAEASCVATLIAMRAAYQGITIDGLDVTVDSVSDDRGILGIDPEVRAGPLSSRVVVAIRARAPKADLEAIVRWGVDHCPVVDAVRRGVPVTVEIDTGD
jgi:uncharacterized OsmC-like protein